MKKWVSGSVPGIAALTIEQAKILATSQGKMIVEVHAAALNFSDLLMIDEKYQIRPPRPFTPGQEISGIVTDAPRNSQWKAGDRIASKVLWGGFAEYAEVRTDMAIRIPDSLGFSQAAALPVVYTTAMVALRECIELRAGQTILVHAAAGGTGLAATEIAKAIGARVIATAGGQEKLDLAFAHGADIG
ncbi:MAG: alcohol dehydrogenase catalytic domain-containing protein, partial [Fimbriimonadaceae bacterium]|nr:alcohol dehydrogenase catalytic domain-containing protein [Alphaproteobacteria bacterium]